MIRAEGDDEARGVKGKAMDVVGSESKVLSRFSVPILCDKHIIILLFMCI